MVRILLVNDDGPNPHVFLPFLKELLSTGYEIYPVIPHQQRSWTSKSMTLGKEISYEVKSFFGLETWLVHGTPADCTNIGAFHRMGGEVDLVVSGPNLGHNVGRASMLSSGTVGAALEGSILGYPSIAISYPYFGDYKTTDFSMCHPHAIRIIKKVVKEGLPENVDLLNINIPEGVKPKAKIHFTSNWCDNYGSVFDKKGDKFVHVRGLIPREATGYPRNTDIDVIKRREISVTGIKANYWLQDIHKW